MGAAHRMIGRIVLADRSEGYSYPDLSARAEKPKLPANQPNDVRPVNIGTWSRINPTFLFGDVSIGGGGGA